jgi:hypothetical protein
MKYEECTQHAVFINGMMVNNCTFTERSQAELLLDVTPDPKGTGKIMQREVLMGSWEEVPK